MFKKIVMMGLAAVAVLSMSACGGESKPEENTSEVASVEDSQAEESFQPEGTEEVEPEQEEQEPEQEEEEFFYIFSEMPIAAYEVTGLKIGPDAALYEGTFTEDGNEYESANYIELASGENTFILYCLPGGDYYDEGRSYSISMPTVHSPSGGSPWEAHAYTSGDEAAEYEFRLEAYINKINHMRRLEGLRESKRVVHVADDSGDDDDSSGVVSDKQMCFADTSDAYADFADACELQYAVEKLNSLNGYFMVNARCDVKLAVRQALRGIPDSIVLLKRLCEEYPVAADLLKIILGSGQPYESMFPEVYEK